ncbi:Alpha-tubulin suppressor [Carpediemonas membranifera]|uniref:Alpha-tubulin suppressor n=1 Tax=Carpediemonas membranifera TaxID=201153 RepID=A0A8J6B6L0_9EUKA|nr:Alpha-tubulin suppressor [Carpediemonas membranifera]|eukprot:KAG9391062.1 Alpha-tubulin suppressor [Carpediemonas membranifera]
MASKYRVSLGALQQTFADANVQISSAKSAIELFLDAFEDEESIHTPLKETLHKLDDIAENISQITENTVALKRRYAMPMARIIAFLHNLRAFLQHHNIRFKQDFSSKRMQDLKHIVAPLMIDTDISIRAALIALQIELPPFDEAELPRYDPETFSLVDELQVMLDMITEVQANGGDRIDPSFTRAVDFSCRRLRQGIFVLRMDLSLEDVKNFRETFEGPGMSTDLITASVVPLLICSGVGEDAWFMNSKNHMMLEDALKNAQVSTVEGTEFMVFGGRLFTRGNNISGQTGTAVPDVWVSQRRWVRLQGRVRKVFAEFGSVFALTDRGVFAWGDNASSKLGLGLGDKVVLTPGKVKLPPGTSVIDIVPCARATFFRTPDGWWSVGTNWSGQLGLGHVHAVTVPEPIPGSAKIFHIVSDYNSSFAWSDNVLLACGNNDAGQLGIGTRTDIASFTPVRAPADVSVIHSVVCGMTSTHFMAGNVCLASGMSRGQLGLPLNEHGFAVPTKLSQIRGEVTACATDGDSTVFLCGGKIFVAGMNFDRQFPVDLDEILDPVAIEFDWPVRRVVLGGRSLFVQRADTSEWFARGDNELKQLGVGDVESALATASPVLLDGIEGVHTIFSAGDATIFLSDTGIFAAGGNERGRLGVEGRGIVSCPKPVRRRPDYDFWKLPGLEVSGE